MFCDAQLAFKRNSLTMLEEIRHVSDARKLSPGRLRSVGVVGRLELENVP